MIEVTYKGQLGNRLFQYCLGRIMAEELGYCLKVEPLPQFPKTMEAVRGKDFAGEQTLLLKGERIDLPSLMADSTPRHIHLRGFFQRYEYFKSHKTKIRDWLRLPEDRTADARPGDIAISLRRGGDYQWHKWCTPFSFFEQALESTSFQRLLIVTNAPRDPYLERFSKYNPLIVSDSQMDDFKLLMACEKLILSESTFGWWAAFLSEAATEIHFPRTTDGLWSAKHPEIDLFVDDEPRYRQHEVTIPDVPTLPEVIHREAIFVRRRVYHVLRELRKAIEGTDEHF